MREGGRDDKNKGNVGNNYCMYDLQFTIVINPFTIWPPTQEK